jgi:hypothetical protein
MGKRAPKRHLVASQRGNNVRTACGIENPSRWTHAPSEVTCVACSRTERMAHAEVTATRRRLLP